MDNQRPAPGEVDTRRTVSPSGLKTWRRCQRLWWYKYCLGYVTETTEAQARGHAVEALIVNYMQGKGLPLENPLAAVALAALEYLPAPGSPEARSAVYQDQLTLTVVRNDVSGAWVNAPAEEAEAPGVVTYHGASDIRYWGADDCIWLTDIKCTSNLGWCMTDDEFVVDPQRIIYSAALAQTFNRPVVAQWLYLETYAERGRPHRSRVIARVDTREELFAQMEMLHADGQAIAAVDRAAAQEQDMPRNLLGCFAFGTCGMAEDCVVAGGVPAWQRLAGWVRQMMIRDERRKLAAAEGER